VARPRRTFRNDSNRRKTEWSAFDGAAENVANGGATLLSGIAFENPGTIVRTRGIITVFPQDFSADSTVVGAFGIGMVSAEAFAAGVASIPEPFSDADWGGWMVMVPFTFHFEFQSATGAEMVHVQYEVDSKAMRKVEPSTVLVAVAESFGGAFAIVDMTRSLLMLH